MAVVATEYGIRKGSYINNFVRTFCINDVNSIDGEIQAIIIVHFIRYFWGYECYIQQYIFNPMVII